MGDADGLVMSPDLRSAAGSAPPSETEPGRGWLQVALEDRGISRRRFLGFASAMTALLALPSTMTPQIVNALETKPQADGRLARVPGLRRQHGVDAPELQPARSPTSSST